MSASLMTEAEVAVLISYSGSTKDTIEVAKVAKKEEQKLLQSLDLQNHLLLVMQTLHCFVEQMRGLYKVVV